MKTLFDTLKGQLNPGKQPGVTDQTAQTQSLLRAKLGKSTGSGAAPGISNIQEQQAVKQAQLQNDQQGAEAQIAGQQLEQQNLNQQAQEQESMFDLASKRADVVQNFNLTSDNLLKEFERDKSKLSNAQDAAKLEQLGFNLRLQDQSYLANLKQNAEKAQLKDMNKFKIQAAKAAMGDDMAIFKDDVAFRKLMDSSDRAFQTELSKMNLGFAMDLAKQEAKTTQQIGLYTGVGNVVGAGAAGYDKLSEDDK